MLARLLLLCLVPAGQAASGGTAAAPPALGRSQTSRRGLQQATPAPEAACLPSQTLQWTIQSYAPLTMCRSGALQFTWTGIHTVALVPGPFCHDDWTAPGVVQLAPVGSTPPPGGSYTAALNLSGTLFFACSYSTHCMQGQHIVVTVV